MNKFCKFTVYLFMAFFETVMYWKYNKDFSKRAQNFFIGCTILYVIIAIFKIVNVIGKTLFFSYYTIIAYELSKPC